MLGRRHREQLALVIAGEVKPVLGHQSLRRLARQQRAREAVPQVHHRIDAAMAEILDHGLQSREVAVDVREEGDPHGGEILAQGLLTGWDRS